MNKTVSIIATLLLFTSCKLEKNEILEVDFATSYASGKQVYNNFCITCHLANGEGVPKAFPPIANSDFLEKYQAASIKGLKYGMSDNITVNGIIYKGNMTAQGLSNQEIADVMNYINNTWNNKYGKFITAEEVLRIAP